MKNLSTQTQQTMSSLEIANLTGKQHRNVLADIRKLFDELELVAADFTATALYTVNNATRGREIFNLTRDLTDCLLTGYSAKMRMAVIARWRELEDQVAQQPQHVLPQNYREALVALLDTVIERDELLIENDRQGQEIVESTPKVVYFDQVAESDVTHNISNVASKVGMTAQELNKILDSLDVYDKRVKIPRQFKNWFIKDGLGLMITTQTGHSQARLTTRGEQWTIRQLHDLQLIKKKEHKNAHHHLMFDEAAYNPYAI